MTKVAHLPLTLVLLLCGPCVAQPGESGQTTNPAAVWAKAIAEARKAGLFKRLAGKRYFRPKPEGGRIKAVVTEVIDHGDQVEFSYFLLRPDQRARIERYRLDAKGHLASFELLMGNEKGIERGIRGKASQQGLDLEVFGPGEHQRVTRPCAPGTLPMNLAEHFLPSLDEFLPAKVELKILVGTMTHPGKALLARPPTVDPDRPGGAGNDRSWLLSVEAAEGAPHLHMTIWVSKTGAISGLRQGQYLEALTPQEGRKLLGVPERGEEPAKRTEEAEPKSDESAPKGD